MSTMACTSDDLTQTPGAEATAQGNVTLTIRQNGKGTSGRKLVNTPHRDLGHAYDYRLHDLCLFIYESTADSPINSLGYTPLTHKIYLTEDQFTQYTDRTTDGHTGHEIDAYNVSVNFNLADFKRNIRQHLIVVANVGDITEECNTLADVRDYQPAEGFKHGAEGYSQFAMGLYEEPQWITDVAHNATDVAPHKVNITLERIAARVDFQLGHFPSTAAQAEDACAPIPYDVQVSGSTLARNWVTHARVINAMQHPSYIIRRTATDPTVAPAGDQVTYLGEETNSATGVATNTYLTPYTADMASTSAAALFGATALETARLQDFSADERVMSRQGDAEYGDDGSYYHVIGYTQENTLRTDQMLRQYATGILYRTIFEPATVWRLNEAGDDIVEDTKPLSTSMLSTGSAAAGGLKGEHYGKSFWMMEALVPQPTEADRVYFMTDITDDPDAAEDEIKECIRIYRQKHPELGYTDAQKFTDGVAYNYYWLRHTPSQGEGHPFTAMEYSVVRNTIYSVRIQSFSGPGAPSTDPTMDNPDRIQPITYVHPWHSYEVEEIQM